MRAIRVAQTGGPEVLQLQDVETPAPAPGELLIAANRVADPRPRSRLRTSHAAKSASIKHAGNAKRDAMTSLNLLQ